MTTKQRTFSQNNLTISQENKSNKFERKTKKLQRTNSKDSLISIESKKSIQKILLGSYIKLNNSSNSSNQNENTIRGKSNENGRKQHKNLVSIIQRNRKPNIVMLNSKNTGNNLNKLILNRNELKLNIKQNNNQNNQNSIFLSQISNINKYNHLTQIQNKYHLTQRLQQNSQNYRYQYNNNETQRINDELINFQLNQSTILQNYHNNYDNNKIYSQINIKTTKNFDNLIDAFQQVSQIQLCKTARLQSQEFLQRQKLIQYQYYKNLYQQQLQQNQYLLTNLQQYKNKIKQLQYQKTQLQTELKRKNNKIFDLELKIKNGQSQGSTKLILQEQKIYQLIKKINNMKTKLIENNIIYNLSMINTKKNKIYKLNQDKNTQITR